MNGRDEPRRTFREQLIDPRASLALATIGLALFMPSLTFDFVFEDVSAVLHNSAIRSFDRLPDLLDGSAVRDGVPDAWRPLMVLSQMVDYALFGLNPRAHHMHSVLWHVACGLMVWLFVRRLSDRERLARWTAALFIAHPIHVEVVSNVSFREDSLSTFFSLAALTVLLRPMSGRPDHQLGPVDVFSDRRRDLVPACVLFALALLAKGTESVIPVLYALLFLAAAAGTTKARLARLLPAVAALTAIVLLFVTWRLASAGTVNPYPALDLASVGGTSGWLARWPSHAQAFLATLTQMFVPVGLSPFYPEPAHGWSSALGIGSVLVVALLAAGSIALLLARRAYRTEAVALMLILVTWAPMAGLFAIPALRFDRYAYLPSLGACLLLASLLLRIPRQMVRHGALFAVLVAFAAACVFQQRIWRTELTLWQAATAGAPESAITWTGLAKAKREKGVLNEAEAAGRKSVALDPRYAPARLVLANVLSDRKKFHEAFQHYRTAHALGLQPALFLHTSWGWTLHRAGRTKEAEKRLRRAVAIDPGFALAHANLGRVLASQGRLAEARRELRKAIALGPADRAGVERSLQALDAPRR